MLAINRIFIDIFTSLSFAGSFPMTAPRHGAAHPVREPAPQPQLQKAPSTPVRRPAQAARPAFG